MRLGSQKLETMQKKRGGGQIRYIKDNAKNMDYKSRNKALRARYIFIYIFISLLPQDHNNCLVNKKLKTVYLWPVITTGMYDIHLMAILWRNLAFGSIIRVLIVSVEQMSV